MYRVQTFWFLLVWLGLVIARRLNDVSGDKCKLANGTGDGICTDARDCPYLRTVPQTDWITCGFNKSEPIVCCGPGDVTIKSTKTKSRVSLISERMCESFSMSGLSHHVFGGSIAAVNEFPHVAALGYLEDGTIKFRCGSSLISERYLLTAAHCVKEQKPQLARFGVVHLFEVNPQEPPVDIGFKNSIIHPNYTSRPLRNDIALLELDRSITEPFIHPACLYTNLTDPEPHVILSIEGWGSTDPNDFDSSPILLKANVTTLDREGCNSTLVQDKSRRSLGPLQNEQLCALGRNLRNETVGDTCVGDSGGPLELILGHRRYLVGVTSSGRLCGSTWPGVYTRISRYIDWVESIVWKS
ncbi:serine protease persephone-like isoform X2 [Toxorhynchites rutilus septentrionalis]|uniref:serine protease persephone-like isoform X2 n=1 Tax=Toxorhynchites rutilus septentrionalis TaxID=329112 RepID=UPI00247833AE|nr:serine protease persephone-like isoform X2 [Toxorhynchites rutilus septentrionalis]